jgi:aspartate kinase
LLIVQKYGGSSIADAERIKNVAKRIANSKDKNTKIVIVLSAQGDTTDILIGKAKEINDAPSERELDMLLSTGEQLSCALMAMALNDIGIGAKSLNAFQANIFTSSKHGNAKIKNITADRIMKELDQGNIAVVTGFQGYDKYNDITTLGRGGSDTTAVAIAAALRADKCEIYTDVEGVYTADPRIVSNAVKHSAITYDEMMELASLGAKVLHNRSVELARKYQIELVVRSSLSACEGTVVKEGLNMEKLNVSGVAVDKDVARISVIGVEDKPGIAFRLFDLLSRDKISVDIILQSIGRDNTKDISFTVAKGSFKKAKAVLENNKDRITAKRIVYDEKVAKVSIVGAGMTADPGVASTMFEALYDADINISMISTSEIKISVLINEDKAEKAMRTIHDKFALADLVKG